MVVQTNPTSSQNHKIHQTTEGPPDTIQEEMPSVASECFASVCLKREAKSGNAFRAAEGKLGMCSERRAQAKSVPVLAKHNPTAAKSIFKQTSEILANFSNSRAKSLHGIYRFCAFRDRKYRFLQFKDRFVEIWLKWG